MKIIFYWLIIGLLFLLIELINPSYFFFVSFFLGSLGVAIVTSFYDISLMTQGVLFFIISCISFLALYCLLKKNKFYNAHHPHRTNFLALQGKRGIVIEEIKSGQAGQIKIGGELWLAKGSTDEMYQQGSRIEVVEVVGCHCIVKLINF